MNIDIYEKINSYNVKISKFTDGEVLIQYLTKALDKLNTEISTLQEVEVEHDHDVFKVQLLIKCKTHLYEVQELLAELLQDNYRV